MLTLTRGESGDNAIGPELFDAVGLIRTEELLAADRYYGVDNQYFTTAIDYGFSKRLDEALEKWGRENVLRDVVRIIRIDRPLVLISRFQGNERDGHGNHQAAGLLTQEAYRIGLVNEVVPGAILIARAEDILKQIYANAPIAVKYSLEAVNKGMETSLDEGLSLEASFFGLCAGTEDKKEGTAAFFEKRKAQFAGK